jgi:hypothetical protein
VTADGKGHARGLGGRPDHCRGHHDDASTPAPARGQRAKRRSLTNWPDQADRRERPLVRRRCSTARPAFDRIRRRKPCFLLRLRLFGWNVLFTHGLLERPGHLFDSPWGGARHRLQQNGTSANGTVRNNASGARQRGSLRLQRAGPQSAPERVLRTGPNDSLVALSTALIWSAARPRRPGVLGTSPHIGQSKCAAERTTDCGRETPLGGVSAHMWTYLWTTSGSRQRGHTCSR